MWRQLAVGASCNHTLGRRGSTPIYVSTPLLTMIISQMPLENKKGVLVIEIHVLEQISVHVNRFSETVRVFSLWFFHRVSFNYKQISLSKKKKFCFNFEIFSLYFLLRIHPFWLSSQFSFLFYVSHNYRFRYCDPALYDLSLALSSISS